jgi:hypothetical protein
MGDLGMPDSGPLPVRPWRCSHCGREQATDDERRYGVHNACAEVLRERRQAARGNVHEARGSRRKGK